MISFQGEKLFFAMMAGLPCSGKTTLARALGRASGWPVVNKDLYKSSLIQSGSGLTDEETGRIAYELLFDQAEEFIVQQRLSIIFDTSAHKPFILKHATDIAVVAQAEIKIIHCFASANIRQERLSKRATTHFHYPFMLSMTTMTIENEPEYFRHLPGGRLSIDTQKPIEICLEECSQYILQSEGVLDR